MYHRENQQEDFLVVAGECLLVVEGEERQLRTWDFVQCQAEPHTCSSVAGDGPSVVVAVGARGGRKGIVYLVDETAIAHGAGVEQETTKSAEAYARFPGSRRATYREGWLRES